MIIGLVNKMDNMKIEIMNTVSKQIDSLKFQQKLVEEQESLSIFCPKCRRNHFLRECPLDIKETNKCVICTENHATEKCPSIPGLQAILEGGQPEVQSLHVMGARRKWLQVSLGMAPEPPLHYFCYNAHSYSYPNNSRSQHWQHGNQYYYGQPSQSWKQGWRGPNHSYHSPI